MSKSVPTILVFGALATIALSLMMRHLADVKSERAGSPYAPAVENALGSKVIGSLRIEPSARAKDHAPPDELVVHARVSPGAADQRTADRAGHALWLGAMRAGRAPRAVAVVLTDDETGEERSFEVARPLGRRAPQRQVPLPKAGSPAESPPKQQPSPAKPAAETTPAKVPPRSAPEKRVP
ncbi:MAG: hypothetical protein AB8H80_10605 [Planctomycetota bacterium]